MINISIAVTAFNINNILQRIHKSVKSALNELIEILIWIHKIIMILLILTL